MFSTVWSPDDPLTLAAGGSKAKVQVWDVSTNANTRQAFHLKLKEAGRVLREKENSSGGVIGVVDDNEDSEEEE